MLAILTCAIGLSACSGNQDPVESRPAWNDINVIDLSGSIPEHVKYRLKSYIGPGWPSEGSDGA